MRNDIFIYVYCGNEEMISVICMQLEKLRLNLKKKNNVGPSPSWRRSLICTTFFTKELHTKSFYILLIYYRPCFKSGLPLMTHFVRFTVFKRKDSALPGTDGPRENNTK